MHAVGEGLAPPVLFGLCRSSRVAKDVDPYGFAGIDHNLFREIPLRALPMVGFDFADNT